MRIQTLLPSLLSATAIATLASPVSANDWLIDPSPYRAAVSTNSHSVALENGLVRRVIRLTPNAATISLKLLTDGTEFVRAVRPEAVVELDGTRYDVGGLDGQPVQNYVDPRWLEKMTANPAAFQFKHYRVGQTVERFPWKKRRDWMPADLMWPTPGKSLTLTFAAPKGAVTVDVHYEVYDGLPLISKWITVRNSTGQPVRLDKFICEVLAVAEAKSIVDHSPAWRLPNLFVETDYTFGGMPCLGAQWGVDHLAELKHFMQFAGLGVLEHDGSYPGDQCAATNHPHHRGLNDSQWVMWKAITDLYKWCRANGVYLNIPDWYFLNGGTKTAMGYRETNWSLPREHQEIIERQNIFDGTWEKTPSMGWMFVPLTEYQGGGAAATIDPLKDHLPHYEQRLANLFGAGVQACYRGPRLFDAPETEAVVRKWVSFYKQHRAILDSDIIHLRRADGRDIDYILHVNPALTEKGLLMIYNPLDQPVTQTLTIPLYYTGLQDAAIVRDPDGNAASSKFDRHHNIALPVTIRARSYTYRAFE